MDDRDRRHDRDYPDRRRMWMPWAAAAFGLLFFACFAFADGTRGDHVDEDHYMHGWAFGPGLFFGLFMMFVVFGIFRRMFWWGGWHPYDRPWRYRRYYRYGRAPYDDEREWEEWHRRAHERMDGRAQDGTPGTDAGNGGARRD